MIYGEIIRQIDAFIKKYGDKSKNYRILEVACGPGHISLELARLGYDVTGVDISASSIEIARKTAENDPYFKSRGNLNYHCVNIFDFVPELKYDMIVFSCSMHHFGDLEKLFLVIKSMINSNSLVYVSEPARLDFSENDALIVYLIRQLLSLGGNYYLKIPLPQNYQELEGEIKSIKNEFAYLDDKGENIQSPLDNEVDYHEMIDFLERNFETIEYNNDFSFFDRIIGGLRFDNIEQEHCAADFIKLLDNYMLSRKLVTSGQFHYIGRNRIK